MPFGIPAPTWEKTEQVLYCLFRNYEIFINPTGGKGVLETGSTRRNWNVAILFISLRGCIKIFPHNQFLYHIFFVDSRG